jgi:hypothetical protein
MRRTQRDKRLVQLLTAALVLLGLNTLLLIAILLRPAPRTPEEAQVSTAKLTQPTTPRATQPSTSRAPQSSTPQATQPTTPQATQPTAQASTSTLPSTPSAPVKGTSSLEAVLQATVEPLQMAASDFGLDLIQVLPSEAERRACVASESIGSEPCVPVVAKLKAGYESANMPFPNLIENLSKAAPTTPSAPGASPPGSASSDPAPGEATAAAPVADPGKRDILRAFFSVTTERLSREADKRGKTAQITLPGDAAIEAAAASGSLQSEASQALLGALREQYQALGLEFPEPPA